LIKVFQWNNKSVSKKLKSKTHNTVVIISKWICIDYAFSGNLWAKDYAKI